MSTRFAGMLVLVLSLAAPRAGAQATIELRASARITPGVPLILAHVAALNGAEAVALAGVPLAATDGKAGIPASITLDEVRRAIDAQGKINWGRISLRGSVCTLQAAGAPEPRPAGTVTQGPPPPVAGTIRAAAADRIAQILSASPDDLRLTFAPDDDPLLNTVVAGRTLEIRATGMSDRLPLTIALYQGNRTVASGAIRVGVQVRREVLVATAAKRRGETIGSDDVVPETRWLGPTAAAAAAEQTIGAAVQSHLDVGEMVMADDVTPGIVVNKGEIVAVRCLSGSVVVSTRARALAQGRDGDLVPFQTLGSGRTFFARMDGRGRAVVTAGDAVPAETTVARAIPAPRAGRAAPPSRKALEAIR